MMFNANHKEQDWKLPDLSGDMHWNLILDSSGKFNPLEVGSGKSVKIPAWSVVGFEIKK